MTGNGGSCSSISVIYSGVGGITRRRSVAGRDIWDSSLQGTSLGG